MCCDGSSLSEDRLGCPPGHTGGNCGGTCQVRGFQVEAARMLEIAPSAVSQYLSGKRGYRIEFEDDVKRSIGLLAGDLKDGKQINLVKRTCDICRQLREGEDGCDAPAETRCGS